MKKTFVCDDSMIITIPIRNLKNTRDGQLMPENFQCVYRDNFKVFVANGKPKPLGAAQAITGVLIVTLGLIAFSTKSVGPGENQVFAIICALPSVLFVVSGMLTYAAGQCPNMFVTKLSFSLNIISFLWSIVAVSFSGIFIAYSPPGYKLTVGIIGLVMCLLVAEKLIAVFLIHWMSKAVSRSNFNTLPIILLKQED